MRQLLEDILPKNTSFNDFEIEHNFSALGRRNMVLNARRIYQKNGKTLLILLAFEDITEYRKAEEDLKSKIHQLERFTKIAVGRELRIKELKDKVKKLELELKKENDIE
ncbi:MAG: hypothetical protein ABIH08_02405 [Candidatus Omnitrophota bacterium]